MTNITDVGVTNGKPTSGTGTVSTIDKLIGDAGAPSSSFLSVQGSVTGLPIPVIAPFSIPKGYQQITVVSSAVGFTIPSGATSAIVAVAAQDVRWRDDGTNPTSSVGMPLAAGTTLFYDGNALAAIKFIEQNSGAILNISYYA